MPRRMKIRLRSLGISLVACLSFIPARAEAYGLWAWLKARLSDSQVFETKTEPIPFQVSVVAQGLKAPWAIASLPDGRILVTERPGRLRMIRDGQLEAQVISGVPDVSVSGQGGLLDIALHPQFETTKWIYLSYVVDENGERLRVSRFRWSEEGLMDPDVVFPGVAGSKKSKHFGGRIAFGADGKLYITLGERGEGNRAQDLMDLNGKTLRLNDDGSVPIDNPFVGRTDARGEIFSFGHRNSQGMAIRPGTNDIWQTEHGPTWNDAAGGGDEINFVEAKANYGWPEIHHRMKEGDMRPPLLEFTPANAPAGATFYEGDAFPMWNGDFFFATLKGESLIRLKIEDRRIVAQETLLSSEYGRLRDVAVAQDGSLLVATSNDDGLGDPRPEGDKILRLAPVSR